MVLAMEGQMLMSYLTLQTRSFTKQLTHFQVRKTRALALAIQRRTFLRSRLMIKQLSSKIEMPFYQLPPNMRFKILLSLLLHIVAGFSIEASVSGITIAHQQTQLTLNSRWAFQEIAVST